MDKNPEIVMKLNNKFPCPSGYRGDVVGWRTNKLCGLRHKRDVPVFECKLKGTECTIEPYAAGQQEDCCKRCEHFWRTDELKLHQLGVNKPAPLEVKLRKCVCGRMYEGTQEYKGCGITRCINPDYNK